MGKVQAASFPITRCLSKGEQESTVDNKEHPARKIKFLLKNYSMSPQVFTEKIGITMESLRDILDEREMPTPHILYKICNLFNLSEGYFGNALRSLPGTTSRRGKNKGSVTIAADELVKELRSKTGLSRNSNNKLDMAADLAARHQALVDLLVSKKVITSGEYHTRLEILRAKVQALQKKGVERAR